MTPQQIQQELELHQLWQKTNKTEGRQANLSNLHLQDIDFNGKTWKHLILQGCVLQNLSLENASFEHCNLENTHWIGSGITDTSFFACNMQYAYYEKCSLFRNKWKQCDMKQVYLRKCQEQYNIYAMSRMIEMYWDHCSMKGNNVHGSNMKDATLLKCWIFRQLWSTSCLDAFICVQSHVELSKLTDCDLKEIGRAHV